MNNSAVIKKKKNFKLIRISTKDIYYTHPELFSKNGICNDNVYIIKVKHPSQVWKNLEVILRKKYSNVFTIVINGGKIESDVDYENRAITLFDKAVCM